VRTPASGAATGSGTTDRNVPNLIQLQIQCLTTALPCRVQKGIRAGARGILSKASDRDPDPSSTGSALAYSDPLRDRDALQGRGKAARTAWNAECQEVQAKVAEATTAPDGVTSSAPRS
jgi:hypothetical protein